MRIERERLAFYSSMFRGRSSAREIIECAERMQVGGVELMNFCDELREPDVSVAKSLGRMARAAGLALPCFSVGIDIISDTVSALNKLRGYAEICSELEIPYLHHTIALDYQCGGLPEAERERRFAIGAAAALELANFCAPLGVKTLIEPQGFVFNGIEWVERMLRLSDERIGVVADIGNVLFADTDPSAFIRKMGSRIYHAHIKDYTFKGDYGGYTSMNGKTFYDCEIGCGDLDFSEISSAFSDISYSGMYSLEFANASGYDEVMRVLERISV